MINHAIGASGVVSKECKEVVQQYGQNIIDLLLAQVIATYIFSLETFMHIMLSIVQMA